jgi:hypothetical protein
MSTIFFGAEELANVAVVASLTLAVDSKEGAELLAKHVFLLSLFSEVNAKAYSVRYSHLIEEPAVPWTAHEILDAALVLMRDDAADKERSARTAMLLEYNADGLLPDELATEVRALDGLLSIFYEGERTSW